ncbi:hypothetical protein [Paenibacillus bovis]|uniref:hypothetical protein n=1 Tax=Paenibacillus bovis TaxID=1616788 RepID=UPI001D131CA1|nr:hypothetical protein [Paenibacillus bovis]
MKKIIGGVKFIMVGHHALHGFSDQKPLYLLEEGDGVFTVSSLHNPPIYKLNKNLEIFFCFILYDMNYIQK